MGSRTQISNAVIDSGASFTSIPKDNQHLVIPGSWSQLKLAIQLDGIAGGIRVKWKCRIRFETVNHEGEVEVYETKAYYHQDLPCMLLSPQAFLQGQYLRQVKGDIPMPLTEDKFAIYRNRAEWYSTDRLALTVLYDKSFCWS